MSLVSILPARYIISRTAFKRKSKVSHVATGHRGAMSDSGIGRLVYAESFHSSLSPCRKGLSSKRGWHGRTFGAVGSTKFNFGVETRFGLLHKRESLYNL